MIYRYYKITPRWAKRTGLLKNAVPHPDGWYLVLPNAGDRIAKVLAEEEGLNLMRDEAFEYIGAIGLNVAEASASYRGELTHEISEGERLDDDETDKEGGEA